MDPLNRFRDCLQVLPAYATQPLPSLHELEQAQHDGNLTACFGAASRGDHHQPIQAEVFYFRSWSALGHNECIVGCVKSHIWPNIVILITDCL